MTLEREGTTAKRDGRVEPPDNAGTSANELQFRALADNIPQLAWMADQQGQIYWYNKRWHDYTGLSLDVCRGEGWLAAHHPDHATRVLERIRACFASGEPWEDTFPLRSANGSYTWFLSRAMPVRDDAGRVALWCGTNTDVSEQRALNARLREKARLIELSHSAIMMWDSEEGIRHWNHGCSELYGYSREEATGKLPRQLLQKTHTKLSMSELDAILRSDGAWSGEILCRAKDGRKLWIEARIETMTSRGRRVVLETHRDITDRREWETLSRLLISELDHRVKNTLAIVQSIASQTARFTTNRKDFVASFTDRLQAISAAHNALSLARWRGARLVDLIRSEATLTRVADDQLVVDAGDHVLPPQVALQVMMVLHELMSNAVRHGALSRRPGRVTITAKPNDEPRDKLCIIWTETGGPEVEAPTRRGFGHTLISRTATLPNIAITIAFPRTGVECRIDIDLTERDGSGLFDPERRQ